MLKLKTCIELFIKFFKIGGFTLGGGYAMLALVEREVTKSKKWLKEDEFWDMITIVQSLPGVFAINTALYVGYKICGKSGAFAAFMGAVLPSLIIIGVISTFFMNERENETVVRIFKGIRPCVVALILAPSIRMFFKSKLTWKHLPVPIIACALIVFAKVSPIYIIAVALIGGMSIGIYNDKKKSESEEVDNE